MRSTSLPTVAVTIRELTSADVPFLRRMLCTALFWRRKWLPDWVALRLRQVAIYHEHWGRPGDTGFVAEEDGTPIGAVWYRFFTEDEHGEGYVDAQTPELAIAVVKGRRGRRVGSRLFEAIHEQARRDGVRRISLSVDSDNPAKRLYAALGYVDYDPPDENGRMILELAEPAPSTPERVNGR
jgi:GNAT superfamily N-acetyltransferase